MLDECKALAPDLKCSDPQLQKKPKVAKIRRKAKGAVTKPSLVLQKYHEGRNSFGFGLLGSANGVLN
jgi:hypothetical protein